MPSLTLFSSPCSPGCSAPAPVSCPHLLGAAPPPRILARLCISSKPWFSSALPRLSRLSSPPGYLRSARRSPGFPNTASPWLPPPCLAQPLALPMLLSLPPACSAPYSIPRRKPFYSILIRRLPVSSVLLLGFLDQLFNAHVHLLIRQVLLFKTTYK